MKKYHKNPRTLTKKQYELLKRDLEELGDLSGIVHDINLDEIIGGNQRSEVFDINNCEIEITEEFNQPTKTGTVATGWIKYNGEKYSYRKVSWTPKQCEKANIVANKAGGDWDFDILGNEFEVDDLIDWGFEDFEFSAEIDKINELEEWENANMPEFEPGDKEIKAIFIFKNEQHRIEWFNNYNFNKTNQQANTWTVRL